MKLSDTVWGVLLLALSLAAILWNIRSFPQIPGQNIGPVRSRACWRSRWPPAPWS